MKDACRYPCEEVRLSSPTSPQLRTCPFTSILVQVCEYKDTNLFSGFKPTGFASSSCDGEPEEPEPPEEPEAEEEEEVSFFLSYYFRV